MSGIPQCLSAVQASSIWRGGSYSSHRTNAIIIAKLVLLYAFIKTVVRESKDIVSYRTIVSDIELYKEQIGAYLSTTPNGEIDDVANHINTSFEMCVRNIKKDTEAPPPRDVHTLLLDSALDTFRSAMLNIKSEEFLERMLLAKPDEHRNAMLRAKSEESHKFFSELTTLSDEFLMQKEAFNYKSIVPAAKKMENKESITLAVYLTACKDDDTFIIRSILCGSLFLAAEMKPFVVKPPPKRVFFSWFGGKKSRRHRKRKRQRNRTSRQNK